MITFILSEKLRDQAPLSLLAAIASVEETLEALQEDIDILPVVHFDPLYTKPINLSSIVVS